MDLGPMGIASSDLWLGRLVFILLSYSTDGKCIEENTLVALLYIYLYFQSLVRISCHLTKPEFVMDTIVAIGGIPTIVLKHLPS